MRLALQYLQIEPKYLYMLVTPDSRETNKKNCPIPSANLLKNPILKEWKAELNFVLFFRAGFPNNI